MSTSCKIVILSVSAGAGHVRAAQALQAAAEKWYPSVEAVHVDLMELVPKLFKTVYADTYIKVVERHPAFWGISTTKPTVTGWTRPFPGCAGR